MGCARGKASPNEPTKLRLFADSAGHCQNPTCLRPLFVDAGSERVHIAEMAHIFAASDDGPRADRSLSEETRGAYENLILLCPSCHTIIDKAPAQYPDGVVRDWKREHASRIAAAFGAVEYPSRAAVRAAVTPLLAQNGAIVEAYGPDNEYRYDPESSVADVWRRKVRSQILPNNRRLLAILDRNRGHLRPDEQATLERFRQHVDDLEARHVGSGPAVVAARFPSAMGALLDDETDARTN